MALAKLGTESTDMPAFEAIASRQFSSWLAEQRVSLAFTTYQTGKLFLIGLQPDGRRTLRRGGLAERAPTIRNRIQDR